MRVRLLDATIDCLFELGYAGTTTTVIAERAGVSRGAQLHHFPTKADLVTSAVEHLFQRRLREFRDAFAGLPEGVDLSDAALSILWPMVSGPAFYAWLELVVAARTDAELRAKVTEIGDRFMESVRGIYADLFPDHASDGPFLQIAPTFVLAFLQGLALDKICSPDDPRLDQALEMLKQLSRVVLPSAPRA